jgi:hypothetical protein
MYQREEFLPKQLAVECRGDRILTCKGVNGLLEQWPSRALLSGGCTSQLFHWPEGRGGLSSWSPLPIERLIKTSASDWEAVPWPWPPHSLEWRSMGVKWRRPQVCGATGRSVPEYGRISALPKGPVVAS